MLHKPQRQSHLRDGGRIVARKTGSRRARQSRREPLRPHGTTKAKNYQKGGGLGRVMAGFIDPGLTWEDLKWVRQQTHLPVCLKGVMSADDAILAMQEGLDGIMLSNHGGRNLDTSPPSIITLLELHKRCPEIFDRMEIYVDSGIRRGTDMLKAVSLGATAVGMGRSMLFATNYGQEGVEHLIDSKFSSCMQSSALGCRIQS